MINRHTLVTRHNPKLNEFIPLAPLSVGNGEFAFTVDATGLQTFPQLYHKDMPLATMANWGWHSYPTPDHLEGKKLEPAYYDTFGRKVRYYTDPTGQKDLFNWLRINPHRFHLGQIGLAMNLSNGDPAAPSDIHHIEQELDLWSATISSRFHIENIPVTVTTSCHPHRDGVLIRVQSPLIDLGRLKIKVAFPYPSHEMAGADWDQPQKHQTIIQGRKADSVHWVRLVDKEFYHVSAQFAHKVALEQARGHAYLFAPQEGSDLECEILFSPQELRQPREGFSASLGFVRHHWEKFWLSGGAVQLADSKDHRAAELERRVILSQYLTAIQCSGALPPQETGLTTNSWYGKAHLEMHWWHAAHFPLWGRPQMLARSLWWYDYVLPEAQKNAQEQGYTGARWQKMVGPRGIDTPSAVAPLLVWQQPHPIAYAELIYRANPSREILDRYYDVVMESAAFMADFTHYDPIRGKYVLGAPLIPAQENHKATGTLNPTYELEYWLFGLQTAQNWRQRLGLEPDRRWNEIIGNLAPLPINDGVYLAHENCPETFTQFNYDHPSMLCAYGVVPGTRVNPDVMRQTLARALKDWQWERAWGWDFPVAAMAAAKVGEPGLAVDSLFIESVKNTWLPNGHNYQRPNLPLYLPGNGALLLAVGMMAAGWDKGPKGPAPGFPQDGSWKVEVEGIKAYW